LVNFYFSINGKGDPPCRPYFEKNNRENMIPFTIQEILLLILIGCFSGLLAGLLGVGGGIIFGPVILFLLKGWGIIDEIICPLTFGTSLFIIIFTSLSAVIKYQSMKCIIWRAVLIMSIFSVIGALAGPTVSVYSPSWLLLRLYGLLLLFVAYRILKEYKSIEFKEEIFKLRYLIISGFIIGFISSMFGLGGGVVGIPIMILVLRYPIKKIAGTSSGIIFFTSIAGVIGYINLGMKNFYLPEGSFGFVNLKIALPLMIGAISFAPIGAYLNSRIKVNTLKKVFAFFLGAIGIILIFFD